MNLISLKFCIVFILCLSCATSASAEFRSQGPLPASIACDAVGSNTFVGCYYAGPDFTDLKATRTDSTINFNWASGPPDPSIGSNNFSVKWEGDFSFSTGAYRFTATVDDGIRVYVDDAIILDKWFDQSSTTYTADTMMVEGTHRIKVEYYQHGGGAVAQVSSRQIELPPEDSRKGVWGTITPIADNQHPNLYYNQSEVNELRNMILVQHSPKALYDLYNSQIKDYLAASTTEVYSGYATYSTDMKAGVSYMIEPSAAKADAIHATLLSFMARYPGGLTDWSNDTSFSGYALPWLFDLILAYNPEKLTAAEKTSIKSWFGLSASACCRYVGSRASDSPVYDGQGLAVFVEGTKAVQSMANWWSRFMGPSLACALVSGDQSAVDFWADSGWPHGLFTTDKVSGTYPAVGSNRFDLVTFLLSVFPSGANTDTYIREAYKPSTGEWNTTDYTWGSYHFAQMYGPILGAEMAYHNGMTGVFGVTDVPGTEPALLRTYKRAIASRTEVDNQQANPTGHPIIGWDPAIFAGYRRYSDSTVEAAIPGVISYSGPIPSGIGLARGYDVPGEVWPFFGYPRHIAWTGDVVDPTLPRVTGITVNTSVVPVGASYSVAFSGSNLSNPMYFDVRFHGPGIIGDQEVFNWQNGISLAHPVLAGTDAGIWTITGVRGHKNEGDHSGSFNPLSAAITVPVF